SLARDSGKEYLLILRLIDTGFETIVLLFFITSDLYLVIKFKPSFVIHLVNSIHALDVEAPLYWKGFGLLASIQDPIIIGFHLIRVYFFFVIVDFCKTFRPT
ncbi:hypothetical protein ACJX0J_040255, partial [Zea mays]